MKHLVVRPAPQASDGTISFPHALTTWAVAFFAGSLVAAPLVTMGLGGTLTNPATGPLMGGLTAMWVIFIGALVAASRMFGTGNFGDDYAVQFASRDLVAVPLAVALQFALPVVYWPLQQLWPTTFSDEALEKTARELIASAHGVWLALLVLGVSLAAPIVEELTYRGLLQRSLSTDWSAVGAWLVVSAWFAAIHFRPIEFPGLMLAGLLFGGCYLLSGRVGASILAHIAFNACGLFLAAR